MLVEDLFGVSKPLICMVHLRPLPGSPRYRGEPVDEIYGNALKDARAAVSGGCDGLLVENFNDNPYLRRERSPSTVAMVAVAARLIREETKKPVGVNILRNSGVEALAAALASSSSFIRVNFLLEGYVAPEGFVGGVAGELMRARSYWRAEAVKVFADVHVKHSSPLWGRPIEEAALDLVGRGLADAVVVTGDRTGKPPSRELVCAVKSALKEWPVVVGSGVTPDNVAGLAECADAFIVGTYIKRGGIVYNEIDPRRVRRLAESIPRQ